MSALSSHGPPACLQQCGVPAQPNYSARQERQKDYARKDGVRLRGQHEFIASKTNEQNDNYRTSHFIAGGELKHAPYETSINQNQDEVNGRHCILKGIKPGDIIYGIVKEPANKNTPVIVKPLCTAEPLVRHLADIPIKAYIQKHATAEICSKILTFHLNDIVRCEVLGICAETDEMYLGIEGVVSDRKDLELGVVSHADLPERYRNVDEPMPNKYEDWLQKFKESYQTLDEINGLGVNENFALMTSLKTPFSHTENAPEFRVGQANKRVQHLIGEGLEHFGNGQHMEAFQSLEKALSIDPCHVETLTARGGFYANKGSYLQAFKDFERALNLNSNHETAKIYMGETLVALGRSYEDENRFIEATKAYRDCLNIIPHHKEALFSLKALTGGNTTDSILNIPGTFVEEINRLPKGMNPSESWSEVSSDIDYDDNKEEDSDSPPSNRSALRSLQPFYKSSLNELPYEQPVAEKYCAELRLDDDYTESRVRKLLRKAKKLKKKAKKSKKNKENNAVAILEKNKFPEAFKSIRNTNVENEFTENLQTNDEKIVQIGKLRYFSDKAPPSVSNEFAETARHRIDTRLPKAPSMLVPDEYDGYRKFACLTSSRTSTPVATRVKPSNKQSFQINRHVTMAEFGSVPIANPFAQEIPGRTQSCSKSGSQYTTQRSGRSRSLSDDRKRRRRRSRSLSYDRHCKRRRRRSRSLSDDRHCNRRRRRSRSLSFRLPDRRALQRRQNRSRSLLKSQSRYKYRHSGRSRSLSKDRRRDRSPLYGRPDSRASERRHSRSRSYTRHRRLSRYSSRSRYGGRYRTSPSTRDSPESFDHYYKGVRRQVPSSFVSCRTPPPCNCCTSTLESDRWNNRKPIENLSPRYGCHVWRSGERLNDADAKVSYRDHNKLAPQRIKRQQEQP